jgi:hypothetical protein
MCDDAQPDEFNHREHDHHQNCRGNGKFDHGGATAVLCLSAFL